MADTEHEPLNKSVLYVISFKIKKNYNSYDGHSKGINNFILTFLFFFMQVSALVVKQTHFDKK